MDENDEKKWVQADLNEGCSAQGVAANSDDVIEEGESQSESKSPQTVAEANAEVAVAEGCGCEGSDGGEKRGKKTVERCSACGRKIKKKRVPLGKKKITVLVVCLVFGIVALGAAIMASVGAIGNAVNLAYAKGVKPVEIRETRLGVDADGYSSFYLEDDSRDFKVMQLSDVHIGGGFISVAKDKKALKEIATLVNFVKPDLIVITGDMVYPVPLQSGSWDNVKSTKMVCALMDSLGVPWTVTFGNHDSESYATHTRPQIGEIYEQADKCLFKIGPDDIYGVGNNVIRLYNADGSINTAFISMDSNAYTDDIGSLDWSDYDVIHDDQIEWYKSEVAKLNGARSLAFFHIPLVEFGTAWNGYIDGSDEVEYLGGMAGEKGGKSYPGYKNNGLFDLMVEMGSTKGVFCGHDHYNNFTLKYKGIVLSAANSIDHLAYMDIEGNNWQRGCKLITLDGGADFDVRSYLVKGITEDYSSRGV